MSSLYDIRAEYLDALNALTDPDNELDETTIKDTWESLGLEESFDSKAENVTKYIRYLEQQAEIAESEEKRIKARRQSFEKASEKLREMLAAAMIDTGKKTIKTPLFTLSARLSNGKMEIAKDFSDQRYMKAITKLEPDKGMIKEAIESGNYVNGVMMIYKPSLTVR